MKSTFTKTLSFLALTTALNLNATEPVIKAAGISFTENKGQVCDQNYKRRPDVLFSGNNNGLAYHLTHSGLSYQLNRIDSWKEVDEKKSNSKQRVPNQGTIYRVDLTWVGANEKAVIQKDAELPGTSNYYLSQCASGVMNVKSYAGITYKSIYKGVDLKWYEKNESLEYDFILQPKADYSQIKIKIDGAEKISINKNGELEIKTPLGTIVEKAPIAYQENTQVKAEWIVDGSTVKFKLGNYNINLPLTIDPQVRVWGTYYGGAFTEQFRTVDTDGSGNVYVAGFTTGNAGGTIMATVGAHQTTYQAGNDAIIAKFNSAGTRLWGTYYGGSGNDALYKCVVEAGGNIYAVGTTATPSSTLIASAGSHQTVYGGGATDAFVLKFNTSGTRLWSSYYGGAGDDDGLGCALDGSGGVYICGTTASSASISSVGSHQAAYGTNDDAFLARFNTSGVRQWATYYGGVSNDWGAACAVDATGNVYLCGESNNATSAAAIVTPGAHQTVAESFMNSFLVKFSSAGVRQWGTFHCDDSDDYAMDCVTDASGNVFMAGKTSAPTANSGTLIATPGAHQTVNAGSLSTWDGYLVKFNTSGTRQWSTYYGGSDNDNNNGCSLATDAGGNVYMCGDARSSTGIATPGSYQPLTGISYDAYVVKFNTTGVRQWGTYYGGASADYGFACAIDGQSIYIAGSSSTGTGTAISSVGSHQSAYGGGTNDAFLAKLTDCQALTLTVAGTSTVCLGQSTTLSASGTGFTTYTWSTGANTTSISVSPTTTTNYTLTAGTATAGCNYFDVHTVSIAITPTVNISASSSSICSGSSATLTASGASAYAWSTGATTTVTSVSPAITTVYTATGTASSGCTNTSTISISVAASPTVNISASSSSICSGSSATLTASGASTYTWSSGATTAVTSISPTIATIYTATGTAVSGCRDTQTISISVSANPTVNLSASTASICSGSSASLTASGASTYTWSTGGTGTSISVSPTVTTIYTATGTAVSGCLDTQTLSLNVVTTPTLSVNNYTICAGGTATLLASGATTYSWNTGATTPSILVTPATTTNYTVTGTNGGSCSNTRTLSVTVGSAISIVLSPSTSTICIGSSGTITASGATSYTWNTGSNATSIVISPTTTTNYTVNGTSGTCNGTNTISIAVSANPTVAAVSSSSLICTGNTATLSATGASSYNWNPGSLSGTSVVVSPTISTTYTVVGSNAAGCTNTRTVSVTVSACTGINETQTTNGTIYIYPNPNNGEFTLVVPEEGVYTIVNSIGQTIETIELKENSQTISIQGLADGIYYVIGKSAKAKIIVSK
jgi:hypothetical protein